MVEDTTVRTKMPFEGVSVHWGTSLGIG
jgi:hypothetical protein